MWNWMGRRARLLSQISLWSAAVIAIAFGVAVTLRSDNRLDAAVKLSSIGSFAAGLIFGILSYVVAIRAAARTGDWEIAAATDLAAQVGRQWRSEQHLRRLDGADLLHISWTSANPDVAASPAEVVGSGMAGRPTMLRLAGTIDRVGDVFSRLPRGKLVVIGQRGAGKSVLALTLTVHLLEVRRPDEPVPVLLSLSTWKPAGEDVESWLVRRLTEEYPNVAPMPNGAAVGFRALFRSRRILLILDGLDELAADPRMRAFKELELIAAQGQSFVVTCRSDEYVALVESAGRPVPAAAVIEIAPITTAQAKSFLEGSRWSRVREALDSDALSNAELAQALQTPLMLHLARTAYAWPRSDPDELLDRNRFATSNAIEDHLLKSYLPALYDNELRRSSDHSRHLPSVKQDRAIAQLTYLARHTGESFSWWNLHEAVRNWPARSAATSGVALVIALVLLDALTNGRLPGLGVLYPLSGGASPGGVTPAVLPVALIIGFVSPTPRPSSDPTPRFPVWRNVLLTALPIWVILSGITAVSMVIQAAIGEPAWSSLPRLLLNSVLVGLGYAIGHEVGHSMVDLSTVGRPVIWTSIRRAVAACALLAAFTYVEGLLYFEDSLEYYKEYNDYYLYYGSFLQVSPFRYVERGAYAFCIVVLACALQALIPRQHSQSSSSFRNAVGSVIRLGLPSTVAVVASIAIYSYDSPYFAVYAALFGLPAGLIVGMLTANRSVVRGSRSPLRPLVRAGLTGLLVFVVVSIVAFVASASENIPGSKLLSEASIFGAFGGVPAAFVVMLSAYLATPTSDLDRTEPRVALRRDRSVALVIIGLTVLSIFFVLVLVRVQPVVALGFTLLCILLLACSSRWPAFIGARTILFVVRALPWRVMAFLADAHDRGVLRRVGSAYQFRHSRIKDSLARQA